MSGGVGVLCAEGRSEGIDVTESLYEGLTLQLTGNRKVGRLTKEILTVIDGSILSKGNLRERQGGYLEHLTGTLSIRRCDDGSMYVYEIALLEELMDGKG